MEADLEEIYERIYAQLQQKQDVCCGQIWADPNGRQGQVLEWSQPDRITQVLMHDHPLTDCTLLWDPRVGVCRPRWALSD